MRIQYPHRTCVSFSLVKSKTSRKVKSEKSKTRCDDASRRTSVLTVTHLSMSRSRERRRATRVILNELCRKSAALPAVCARSSRAARAPHPPSPHTPHTATRPDRATRSPRPLDALTPRPLDCTRSQLLESDQMPQRHAWGSQRQSETRRIRDARRHTRPWPRCRPHMHTTHAHHTCTPNRLSSLRGERHDVS